MLLLENGAEIPDPWIEIAGDAEVPEGAKVIVPLARLRPGLGVRIGAATTPAELAQVAEQAALVVIDFPAPRDGRGFTLARRLRERHGYTGEIRAAGRILPDHRAMLAATGFSTVALQDGTDLRPWQTRGLAAPASYRPG
jgi:uncharacterized protein (DUF934 family)